MRNLSPSSYSVPIQGCLLGTAVGDAIGLPSEGLSRTKAGKFCGGGLQHRLWFGHGMFSDDTEHTLMVAAALHRHGNDMMAFQRALAWSLRWWMLALPAGVGMSTAKAIVRLWMNYSAAIGIMRIESHTGCLETRKMHSMRCKKALSRHSRIYTALNDDPHSKLGCCVW